MRIEYTKGRDDFSWLELWKAVLYFLQGFERQFIFWFFVLFIVFFWGLVPPLIIAKIIDILAKGTSGESLRLVFGLIIGMGVAHGVASIIRLTAKNKLGDLQTEAVYQIRVKGFERLVDFSLRWHDKENSGNKVQRIQNGTGGIRDLRELMSQVGIQTLSQVIGIFFIFLFLQPFFILFLIFYLGIFFMIHMTFYGKMQTMNDNYNKSQEAASGTYYEGVNNLLTIKTLGVKDSFMTSIDANEKISKDFNMQMRRLGTNKWKIFQSFNALSMIAYLSFVAWGTVTGSISIGQIIVFYTYLYSLMEASANSTDIFDRLIQDKSVVARMMPIYWEKMKGGQGTLDFPKAWNKISIKDGHLNFQKPKSDTSHKSYVLNDLNIEIFKNEKIGVAGQSGGGKSTFAKVLLGLYELETGDFFVDDINFYDIKNSQITGNIALVLQESEMFNMSLHDNITLLRDVDPKLFADAIRISQLENVIKKLPEGLDTPIGEKGHRLSGGERQRIGIARAICKDPDIFIFDESTSALDSRTEQKVQEGIETELKGKTAIIIAHRVTTLRNTDRIVVFEGGSIVEEGKYDDLLANPDTIFNHVYRSQKRKLQKVETIA